MRTLYHAYLCPASRKTRLLLSEKKLDCRLEVERPGEPRQDFLTLNPAGEVPVLVDLNEAVICDGAVISEYLEEAYPERSYLGDDPLQRAEVRRLVAWFDGKFRREVMNYILHEKVLKRQLKLGQPDTHAIRTGMNNIRPHLDYISWLVEHRNWLASDHFSLADITAAAHLSVLDYLGDVPWEKHPLAKEWYVRIKSRPSFRALLEETVPGFLPSPHYQDPDF